jgi:hypothetical protein
MDTLRIPCRSQTFRSLLTSLCLGLAITTSSVITVGIITGCGSIGITRTGLGSTGWLVLNTVEVAAAFQASSNLFTSLALTTWGTGFRAAKLIKNGAETHAAIIINLVLVLVKFIPIARPRPIVTRTQPKWDGHV